jgi:hypothetical protein
MDQPGKPEHAIRRSTRLPLEIPIRLTSLDARAPYSEQCNSNLVNAHGCGLIVRRAIGRGTPVRLEIVSAKHHGTARVVEVVPLGGDPETWLLGVELDVPGNFWGIQYAPSDWRIETNLPGERKPQPDHDSIAAARQVPPRRWRLTDISVGGCYLQSATPFSVDTPVLMSIRAMDTECLLEGIVRISHAGTGMGVEFTHAQGILSARVNELIGRLETSRELPRIFVGRKEGASPANDLPSDLPQNDAETDALLKLIREGSSLNVEQFLNHLRDQRLGKLRGARIGASPPVLLPGQP